MALPPITDETGQLKPCADCKTRDFGEAGQKWVATFGRTAPLPYTSQVVQTDFDVYCIDCHRKRFPNG